MKKVFVAVAVALLGTLVLAVSASAHIVVTPDNSGCTETTPGEKVDSTNGTTTSGITVSGNDEMVTVTVPAGVIVEHICVKTGQSGSAAVNASVPFVGPGSFTVVKTGSGGGISHLEFGISTGSGTTTGGTTGGTTTGGTTGGTTTGGTTTGGTTTGGTTTGGTTTGGATTGGTTTGGTTAGDTAGDVSGGPTGGTTGGTTGGGTTGGTTGGSGTSGGELPFTGFPVWVPLLAAAALLGSGLFIIRRKKGEVH
jgi:hypothetical protein